MAERYGLATIFRLSRSRTSALQAALTAAICWAVVSTLPAEVIAVKDGRLFEDAEIVSQSPLSVLIKHRGGVSSVSKTLLPEKFAALYPPDKQVLADAKALEAKAVAETKAKEVSKAQARDAAASGDAEAQYVVGNMYFVGDGVGKDIVEAIKWYRLAADQGQEHAQFKLGRMYETGEGLTRDLHQAAQWYRKAAEQGNIDAEANLGLLYEKGFGVPRDSVEAAKWYRRAAEQGSVLCQKKMVVCYILGEGVPRDNLEALAWINVAAASGDTETKQLRDYVDSHGGVDPTLLLMVQQHSNEMFRAISANKSRRANGIVVSKLAPREAFSAKGNGTGVIISSSGYVLTAAHVVAGSTKVKVITAQGARNAQVIRSDAANDVAVLKLEKGDYAALAVIPSRLVRLGQSVATIGFPVVSVQGFSPKVTRGEISSLNGDNDDPKKWQISAPVQPGNSGGPLLDENGNVIGIVVSRLVGENAQNVNYAVKSSYALGMVEAFLGDNPPAPKATIPAPRFEDMIASTEQSVVLILTY